MALARNPMFSSLQNTSNSHGESSLAQQSVKSDNIFSLFAPKDKEKVSVTLIVNNVKERRAETRTNRR